MTTKIHDLKKQICCLLISSSCFLSGCAWNAENELAFLQAGTKAIASERFSQADTIESLKAQNSYSPFISNSTDTEYRVNGTIYLSSQRALTMLEVSDNTEITIKGTLETVEGDIALFYKDAEGNVTVLADSRDTAETDIAIDTKLNAQAGTGEIYFAGNSSVCKFDITLGLSEEVRYYMQNGEETCAMPLGFAVEMTLALSDFILAPMGINIL